MTTRRYTPEELEKRADALDAVAADEWLERCVEFQECAAMLRQGADAERRAARLEWQPMATAPKDGTPVLVFSWSLGRVIVRYGEKKDTDLGRNSRWRTLWDDDALAANPTHWMPLPDPPAAALSPEAEEPSNSAKIAERGDVGRIARAPHHDEP